MAKKLIDRIKDSLAKEGFNPRTNASRQWLRAKVKELKPTPSTLMRDRERLKSRSFIGRMYFYYYDPKTKYNYNLVFIEQGKYILNMVEDEIVNIESTDLTNVAPPTKLRI